MSGTAGHARATAPAPARHGRARTGRPLVRVLVRVLVWALSVPILVYRLLISPLLGPRCRFAPSCSEYALEALQLHGPLKGLWLTARRLARCHPWGGQGYDPVPGSGPAADPPGPNDTPCGHTVHGSR